MADYPFTAADLEALRAWDTPTICNALELVVPERRGHGGEDAQPAHRRLRLRGDGRGGGAGPIGRQRKQWKWESVRVRSSVRGEGKNAGMLEFPVHRFLAV